MELSQESYNIFLGLLTEILKKAIGNPYDQELYQRPKQKLHLSLPPLETLSNQSRDSIVNMIKF